MSPLTLGRREGWPTASVGVVCIALGACALSACSVGRSTSLGKSARSSTPSVSTLSTARGDFGILRQFTPSSASVSWAVVESNLTARTFVVRTDDGGLRWHDVSPPISLVGSSYFLDADVGWVAPTALSPPQSEPVYRTLNGGRTWQKLGVVPDACQLDFVDRLHGWCTEIGAAAGSESVSLYRTGDGGLTWTLVSRTGVEPGGSTPDALPFGCDKSITFTSQDVGWTSSACNGGTPFLYVSDDGGSDWQLLPRVPLPPGIPDPQDGMELGTPVVDGPDIAVSLQIGGQPGANAMSTSTDGGRSWDTKLVPDLRQVVVPDLIDQTDWILTDGTVVMRTNDSGVHWMKWTPAASMKDPLGAPLHLVFLSPFIGWAVPDANGGPLWRTVDGGATWKRVVIHAGPFTIPRQ